MTNDIQSLFRVYPVQMIATAPEWKRKRRDSGQPSSKSPKSAFLGILLEAGDESPLREDSAASSGTGTPVKF